MNISDRKNEVRRKIYSKMLKKRQQKSSTRLCDGVIVRKWMQNKSHHHVHESRTFSKRSTWCKQTLTPSNRALTKRRHELISGYSPQMLTTRIVRKLYPRDPKHIRNQLRCDRNAHTSSVSEEEKYWTINPVHVGVELLDKHDRTCDRDVTQWLLPLLWMTEGRSVSVKSDRMTWRSEWMSCLQKFSKNALKASSSQNQTLEGEGSEDKEALERRGFRARVDLRLGVIDTTNVNRIRGRKREEQLEKSQAISIISNILKIRYVCKGNAWTCDMQNKKHHGLSPIQTYQHINT